VTSDRGSKRKIGKLEDFTLKIPKEQKRQMLVDLLNEGKKSGRVSISTFDSSGKIIGGFDIPQDNK